MVLPPCIDSTSLRKVEINIFIDTAHSTHPIEQMRMRGVILPVTAPTVTKKRLVA
jgi:hypothetical protein